MSGIKRHTAQLQLIALIAFATALLYPERVSALAPAPFLLRATSWIGNQVLGYAVGKTIDRALGSEVETELEGLKQRLTAQIQVGANDTALLRGQLEVTESELYVLRNLLARHPTLEELNAMFVRVNADLQKIFAIVDEHEKRLAEHELLLQELQRRLQNLEEWQKEMEAKKAESEYYDRDSRSGDLFRKWLRSRLTPSAREVAIFSSYNERYKNHLDYLAIRVDFSLENAARSSVAVVAEFMYINGAPLADSDGRFALRGQVASVDGFEAAFQQEDRSIWLTLPHSELHLRRGLHHLAFVVSIVSSSGGLLYRSEPQVFWFQRY